MTGRIKWPDRDTQIMSIFGVGDWRSDFLSELFPLFTTWQSEHG
jgi:hypothetical protein